MAIGLRVMCGSWRRVSVRELCLVLVAPAACAPADSPTYESAAQEHSHCAAFYITAALSPANQARQGQLKQKAALHKQSAVTLTDSSTFDRDSGAALEKIQAELKGEQSSINAMVAKTVKDCDDAAARSAELLKRRAAESRPDVSGTRR